MRLQFIANSALAFTIAVFAITAHAQMGASGAQAGSTLGGSSSGSGAGSSRSGGGAGGGIVALPEDFSKLKIAPGFLLDSVVFDEPDLSGQFRVGPDGNVILPFVGSVHVAGDTVAEAQLALQEAFKSAGQLKNPQVTLDIAQYTPTLVTVLGEVNSPGRLQMLAPHSLLEVLSFAGGETSIAGAVVEVRHEEAGKVITASYHYGRNSNGDSIGNVLVHNGDIVIVPRAGIVYVLGQVTRPGGYLMQEDGKLNLAQVISLAQGTTLIASTHHVLIIRPKPDGTFVQFEVSYNDIVHGKTTPPQLQPQDIVYVPNSKLKTALVDAQSVMTSAATEAIYHVE